MNLVSGIQNKEVEIASGEIKTKGVLTKPKDARGIVIFAHGSGSGRFSPRNTLVARMLNEIGLATLLIDLLTPDEEADRRNVFNIALLARRLKDATEWARKNVGTQKLAIGYFGASTGAAAALQAAAELPDEVVSAVVSRGGRPDLATERLSEVKAPTLLIVGENDEAVVALNEDALKKLKAEKRLVIIPGATHLFEEAGALEEVGRQAGNWFVKYLYENRVGS